MAYVISDEGAYRLGLVLLFGNGLYIYQYTFRNSCYLLWKRLQIRKKKKKKVISDGGIYKLGLVIQSRCGSCL